MFLFTKLVKTNFVSVLEYKKCHYFVIQKYSKKLKNYFKNMLTITITLIVLSFSLKYAVIDLVNLNDTITKSLLQNPNSDEEEEEQPDNSTSDLFLQINNDFSLLVFNLKFKREWDKNCFKYNFNLIDLLNLPPEINS